HHFIAVHAVNGKDREDSEVGNQESPVEKLQVVDAGKWQIVGKRADHPVGHRSPLGSGKQEKARQHCCCYHGLSITSMRAMLIPFTLLGIVIEAMLLGLRGLGDLRQHVVASI